MLNSILVASTLLIPTVVTGRPVIQAPIATGATIVGEALSDSTPAHLGIALQLQNGPALDQLLADLQNPESASYHQWLTPDQFGDRFGLSPAQYAQIGSWLTSHGFAVTTYANRLFFEATGTAGDVRRLLGVQLRWITANGRQARTYTGAIAPPEDIAPFIAYVAGLDTRLRFQHHLTTNSGTEFGAQDLRVMYDMAPLISATNGGAKGLTTAVIGTQEQGGPPATGDISYYYQNVSNATATYTPDSLPNPNGDYDSQGANEEYELDVEMHSVGAPYASAIHLVLSPASEVFVTGVNYAVSTLSTATVVSLSLGICEPDEDSTEASTMETYVKQGLAEGQTWFAASGDSGADDCGGGGGGGGRGGGGSGATVDFPADLPEIVGMGGTQMLDQSGPTWGSSGDLTDWQAEAAWNQGSQGGAGGGGVSTLYAVPSYQSGISGVQSGGRNVPDLALMAAPSPGVAVDVTGTSGDLEPIGGTSVASPLAAGIFALVSGQAGCRFGDIHATLYNLGKAQAAGGAAPFHDITSGNNTFDSITGFTAGTGYDAVTGWGSLDVAVLAANWPSCNGSTSSSSSGGSSSSSSATTVVSGSSSSGSSSSSSSTTVVSGSSSSGTVASSSSSSSSSSGTGSTGRGGHSGGSSSGSGSSTSTGNVDNGAGLVSNAHPTPVSGGGGGCSTGAGTSGTLLFGVVLSFLASRRRKTFFFS